MDKNCILPRNWIWAVAPLSSEAIAGLGRFSPPIGEWMPLVLGAVVPLLAALGVVLWVLRVISHKHERTLSELLQSERSANAMLITEKTALEEELLRRTKELSDAKIELELKVRQRTAELERDLAHARELARAKDEFISFTSHDLRTPLDVMRGNLDMVLKGETGALTPETRAYLADVLSSADRLVNLVNDILDISRIESGRMKFELETLELTDVMREVTAEYEKKASDKGVGLGFESAQGGAPVYTDRAKVVRIVHNLLGNAVKFTPKGGAIHARVLTEGDYVVGEVRDSGIGVSQVDQSKLFQKFARLEQGPTPEATQGTGLGLYLSRELARKLGGELSAESEGLGKGAIFRFRLPAAGTQRALEIQRAAEQEVKQGEAYK